VTVYSHEPIDELAMLRADSARLRGLLREARDHVSGWQMTPNPRLALEIDAALGATVQPGVTP
jgi:hypothetical protein